MLMRRPLLTMLMGVVIVNIVTVVAFIRFSVVYAVVLIFDVVVAGSTGVVKVRVGDVGRDRPGVRVRVGWLTGDAEDAFGAEGVLGACWN